MIINFTLQTSFVMLLLLFATAFNKSICCNKKDQKALLIFKQGVEYPSSSLSSWSTQHDCCSWAGVHCNNITRRVTKLDLNHTNLGGTINLQALLQLEFLNYLDLSNNVFESLIIPSFQVSKSETHNQSLDTPPHQGPNFSNLVYLDLSNNPFGMDNLHWLSGVPSLKYLDLNHIDLSNETNWLQSLGMLPSISEISLSFCGLGNINPTFSYVNFTSLVYLDLSGNHFASKCPIWMFNLSTYISYLDLSENNIHGQIPVALLRLQNLESLRLANNELNGSIPDWLGQYEHLQYIDLSSNLFSGSIPSSLGNLSSLITLNLSYNHLSGSLSKSLGQLYNLTSLDVEFNSLVGVLSEKNFSNLSNLESLFLGSNNFEFDFNPNWAPPFQLRGLGLDNSSLGPNFPTWLYTQRSLEDLDLSSSRISIIADKDMFWSFVSNIQHVNLSNNSITGDISNVTINSRYINLDYNNFTGGLPRISSKVYEFHASHSSFSESLFPLLCHPVSSEENLLSTLDVSHNHLTGSLPDCWANWKQLNYLDLGINRLTGEVPPSMATLSNLGVLDLHKNNLSGKFSLDMSNWTNLQYLLLERNKFSGSLPSTMQQSSVVLKLSSNQFTGNIPPQICNLTSLMILDFSNNTLSGSIPHCVYNIMVSINKPLMKEVIKVMAKEREFEYNKIWLLRSIDLSSNNLSGEIPQELLALVQVWSLNLSQNHLTGKIPQNIGAMKNLESLDLSYNKLSGEIPQTISNLSFLDYLNLSYNTFSGQIPLSTQLQSFDSWSFIGNLELCGDPLPKKCNKQEYDNPNLAEGSNGDDIFLKSLYLGMGVGFAVGFWGVCSSLFFIRAWRHNFFQWFSGVADRVYVAFVLKFGNFR